MKILIINGPNLANLGQREIAIYGSVSFDDYLKTLQINNPLIEIDHFQSNIEGELIDKLYEADKQHYDGIVLNAGGYTHTSVALADAVGAICTKVVEVHISSILARESYRHVSLIAPKCIGSIMGFGLGSYSLGIQAIINKSK
ncbi:MAG: type II 3-dehydroquinate dehydratase [Rikenellaceae bacterium]